MKTDIKSSRNIIIEQKIIEYLEKHPDFFNNHNELLNKLELNHNVYGSVSLVEKQILNLRDREERLKSQMSALMQTANDNSKLLLKATDLATVLIRASSKQELVDSLRKKLTNDFGMDACELLLFGDDKYLDNVNYRDLQIIQQLTEQKFITDEPICGRITDSTAQIFSENKDLESYALIPMGDGAEMGIVALGSSDANVFTADLGTLFLRLIGDIMCASMEQYRN